MRTFIYISLLSLSLISCGEAVNEPKDLAAVAGSYYGVLSLNPETEIDLKLELSSNGFYKIVHPSLMGSDQLVRESGVFMVKGDEVELARSQKGFRYFKKMGDQLFVYNLFHQPYTTFSDSAFYLQPDTDAKAF
tara:strand:- start:29 stop:430 length:402 start_codon:yes stop_codon:yes gene_type:complete